MPPDLAHAAQEYAAARASAGFVDRLDWGVIEATGRDRAPFLHALLSNEIKALAPGQGCAATLLDVHGKVQVLLYAWVLEDRILLVTPPATAEKTLQALDHYLFAEKVGLRDVSADTALLLLAGPEAPALCRRLAGTAPDPAPWSHVAATLAGAAVRLVRGGGETGLPEVWVAAPAAAGDRVRALLAEVGVPRLGPAAFEALRIEAGWPRFGADVDPSVLLPEIPSTDLVSHAKGCYPGQEVVVRIRDRGHVNRRLRGLVLEDDLVPPAGAEIRVGEAAVGRVTSAAWSFGLGRPLALGFVRREHAEPGTAVTVCVGERRCGARVSALPFAR